MSNYPQQSTDLNKKTRSKILGKLKVEVCPKCESIFITSKECEACGYQFAIDRIGEPYGDKSFYALKDTYLSSFFSLVRLYPSLERFFKDKKRKYIFELKRRFQLLADTFENDSSPGSEFFIEIRDLVIEMSEYQIPEGYFTDSKWNSLPLWFQMAISEGLNEYMWQKKSQVMARDFGELYNHFKRDAYFPFAKWILIYGVGLAFAYYIAWLSYSS